MPPEVAKRLLDAAEALRRIQTFTAGKDAHDFAASELLRSAVERQFEIVGEALGRAAAEDPSLERQVPALRQVVGLRNRLIHGYDSMDDEIIWDIVQTKLLPLNEKLRALLAAAGFPVE
jgi:uncharacterized protein with HEPN domain